MSLKRLCVVAFALLCYLPLNLAQVTPEEALKKLEEGNKRYLLGELKTKNFTPQRQEQTKGQHPYAIILTCSDSRVPPELIFDEDLGQLFIIRVAGNVIDEVTLGSIEYAAEHLNTQLLVVLGHSSCGAVKATIEGGDFGKNINTLAGKIKPAVDEAKTRTKDKNMAFSLAIEENVKLQADNCMEESKILEELAHEKKFKIVLGFYNIETGEVNFSEHQHKAETGHSANIEPESKAGQEETGHNVKKETAKPQPQKHSEPKNISEGHSSNYLFENDMNVQGNIFTDGKQFCIQVSSWKNKEKAQQEARKLKSVKATVFIMPYTNPENGKTWYRVRVGYFDSIAESERMAAQLK